MKFCPECKAELVTRQLDGIERLVCSATSCRFVVWDNPVPVVAGLVLYEDRVLLARNSAWPAGLFSVITGYLERFESPEQAIEREVSEELGLNTNRLDFIGHYPLQEKNQLIIAYAVQANGQIQLNPEISEIELIDIGQLVEKDFGPLQLTRQIVDDWTRLMQQV